MPNLHNIDIKDLKLSDFPQFNCLCELCDCGCFERGKNEHSDTCKKKKSKLFISNVLPSVKDPKDFEKHSVYSDSYVKFDLGASKDNDNHSHLTSRDFPSPKNQKRRETSIQLGDRDEKLLAKTTSNEHFKMWNSHPAQMAQPYPEFASQIIYPNNQRTFQTTNEKMFKETYRNFQRKPLRIHQFENNFKINHGKSAMSLDSTYRSDYPQYEEANSNRNHIVSRHKLKTGNSEHIPMSSITQNMIDYQYDPVKFKSVWVPKKVPGANNLFLSHLDPHLHPYSVYDDPNRESLYNLQYTDKSISDDQSMLSPVPSVATNKRSVIPDNNSEKSVRYIQSFDNTQIPTLRVIETFNNKFKKIPPIQRSENKLTPSPSSFDDEYENAERMSTYKADFKKSGVDICMSKAYKLLSAKANSNSSPMISIKD